MMLRRNAFRFIIKECLASFLLFQVLIAKVSNILISDRSSLFMVGMHSVLMVSQGEVIIKQSEMIAISCLYSLIHTRRPRCYVINITGHKFKQDFLEWYA